MEATGDFCRLHIRVKCNAKHGQMVAVSGLGVSEGIDAIRLVTTPQAYPIWYTQSPIVLPRKGQACYKYCIVEDGVIHGYESIMMPRVVQLNEADMIVEDEFNIQSMENSEKNAIDPETMEYASIKRRGSELEGNVWMNLAARNSRLLIVCYHLPVSIKRTQNEDRPFEVTWAESLIAKTNGSVAAHVPTFWFGTVSVSIKDVTDAEKAALTNLLWEMNCIPVFLDDDEEMKAYAGFCKTIMWPVFHNVDQLDQIHAAWNLPPDDSSAKEREGTVVLEWNKQEKAYHEAYKRVNGVFAETLLAFLCVEDIVWVHDYHLMLVPKLLREAIKEKERVDMQDVRTVFFLHIPFPTSQIFRTLPEATELLQSMVSADLVGFHAFDHARHFLNAAKRMLGLRSHTREGGMLTLSVPDQDREVVITMSHVSIETQHIDSVLRDPHTQSLVEKFRARYQGRKVILGIDVCQRLSGLALKLSAFEKLMADYTQASGNHSVATSAKSEHSTASSIPGNATESMPVLIQLSIRQGNRLEDEATTSSDMQKVTNELNSKYAPKYSTKYPTNAAVLPTGSSTLSSSATATATAGEEVFEGVVEYLEVEGSVDLQTRVALYLVSEVFLSTPLREGLNLLPLEYIFARHSLSRAGVIVASEFSTCSNLLNGSLKVNPFAPHSVADALDKALHLSNKDCEYRTQRDLPFVKAHPSALWTQQILQELEELRGNIGHGRSVRKKVFPAALKLEDMLDAYAFASQHRGLSIIGTRVFVFDYGGTLLAKEKFDIYIKQTLSAISGRRPPDSLLQALKELSEDPLNIVVVITGLTKAKVLGTFADMPNITLATSHGLVYSYGANLRQALDLSATITVPTSFSSSTVEERKWEYLDGGIDWQTVSDIAVPIITKFTYRTNGTCQTPRFPGIGWSFFGADPEWGTKQAQQLHVRILIDLI